MIRHEFTDRHVQAFMLWMAFQTNQAVDMPGSGVLAYSLVFGRQQRSWSILPGGSHLIDALIRYLEDHGSTIVSGKTVTRLILDGDRCVGVADRGRRGVPGGDGRAVDHPRHPPARHGARASVARRVSLQRRHLRRRHPRLRRLPGHQRAAGVRDVPEGQAAHTAVSAGTVGWPEDVIRLGEDLRAGRFVEDVPWLLVATPTLADPTRAPAGHHTVKLLSQNVYDVPDWDAAKQEHAKRQLAHLRKAAPNFTDDVILAQLVKSPKDYERLNPHMVHGAFHGGDRGIAQSGALRPAPGWGSHRMPSPACTRPGRPPTRAAPSPAHPAATPRWSCSTTLATTPPSDEPGIVEIRAHPACAHTYHYLPGRRSRPQCEVLAE